MIKIIDPKEEIVVYDNSFNEVSDKVSPFKEILKKGDVSSYYFVDGEDDSNKISLGEAFHLQVNAKGVGEFHFFFKGEDFKKDEVINQVATLKEIMIRDSISARHKITTLVNIVKDYNPLFVVYREYEDTYLYLYEINSLISQSMPCFAIPQEQEVADIQEFSIGEVEEEEISTTSTFKKPKTKKKFKYSKKQFINDISRNKFHLLLVLISTLLVEISMPLAILNIYSSNYLYIFLFVCGAIGIAMNIYSYLDYFKRKDLTNPVFYYSLTANAIGTGVGIGVFAIFYNISTKAEGTPGLGSLILIGFLITFIICGATVALVYFVPRNPNPKK